MHNGLNVCGPNCLWSVNLLLRWSSQKALVASPIARAVSGSSCFAAWQVDITLSLTLLHSGNKCWRIRTSISSSIWVVLHIWTLFKYTVCTHNTLQIKIRNLEICCFAVFFFYIHKRECLVFDWVIITAFLFNKISSAEWKEFTQKCLFPNQIGDCTSVGIYLKEFMVDITPRLTDTQIHTCILTHYSHIPALQFK